MASEIHAAAAAIAAAVEAAWTGRTPIQWEGLDFRPPNGPWLRVAILWGEAFEQTIGGPGIGKNEVVGVLSLSIFGRPGRGTGELEAYADVLRDAFNRAEIGKVRFGAPSGPRPAQEREGWIQMVVDIPFTLEETL